MLQGKVISLGIPLGWGLGQGITLHVIRASLSRIETLGSPRLKSGDQDVHDGKKSEFSLDEGKLHLTMGSGAKSPGERLVEDGLLGNTSKGGLASCMVRY
jgi:hypothetical protein